MEDLEEKKTVHLTESVKEAQASSLGTRLEMVDRELRQLERKEDLKGDDLKKMEALIEKRRKLQKEKRIKRLERELAAAQDDDLDGDSIGLDFF